jgi:hypothetical protein
MAIWNRQDLAVQLTKRCLAAEALKSQDNRFVLLHL